MTTRFKQLFTLLILTFCVSGVLIAQKGSIQGKIIDAKFAEGLIGCSIRLDENAGGAVTDLDGNYRIMGVAVGKHKITINYTGYQTKTIEDIEVKNNEVTNLDILMEEPSSQMISEVVIVAKAQRESMSALTILQKTSPVIADGISAETIKRTPDRTTGDVIRRVSGATIQDGRFAVIRGLNDRYNVAMLNGTLLSSTEPDRKAFSFDMFPSSLLDNLLVMKTASPDLPGDFAGGAIILNTKDLPEENYVRVSTTMGYNTATTFKPHYSTTKGGTDWLGMDDGTRAFPSEFPADKATYFDATQDEKLRLSKSFGNDWAYTRNESAAPNGSFQVATGLVSRSDRKVQVGSTLALSYSNSRRLQDAKRYDYDEDGVLFNFNDEQFQNNVLWGALWNNAVKINQNHKLILQATYTTNAENNSVYRTGSRRDNADDIISTSTEYKQNQLLTTRLGGEHSFGERGIKLNWNGGYNQMDSDVPSLRRLLYARPTPVLGEDVEPYRAYIPVGSADLNFGGRFYSKLVENIYNANADVSVPFVLADQKQSVKIGFLHQTRDRSFNARVMGYKQTRVANFDYDLTLLPQDQIFAPENIGTKGFIMDEITNPSDNYGANSNLNATFVMLDNNIGDKLRITWGARFEQFGLGLNALDYTGSAVDTTWNINNLLPSANLTYKLNDEHQLRFSASQTVTRPEFRELAPFSFYDFKLNASILGNPTLKTGKIKNLDLRYEFYPGQNQLFSVSAFYKQFSDPIEFTLSSSGAGSRSYTYQNIARANNYGIEAEIRKNFDFIGANWENLVFFSNAAFIRSTLNLDNVSAYDRDRPLQGQSPYIINTGLMYNYPKTGTSATFVYNVIGDRISQVGFGDPVTQEGYADVYERHRNLLDAQISQRIFKRGEIKLNWSDILRPDFVYYQDNNRNHKFDLGADSEMQRINLGSTISLGLSVRF